jgi:WD40 repeat protein
VTSHDGRRILTAGGDSAARIWDPVAGTPATPPLLFRGSPSAPAFSPDGRRVLTASGTLPAGLGEVRVWDAATGEPIAPLLEHGGRVRAAFSPDGRHLITACAGDDTARVWDLTSDQRPTEDLVRLAELLSCHQIDATAGSIALAPQGFRRVWQRLRSRYPGEFVHSRRAALAWPPPRKEKEHGTP